MTRQERRNMNLELVEQWRQSGLTQKEFSLQKGIGLSKLKYWINKSKEQKESFIQINPWQMSSGILIRYPNGIELTLPAQTGIKAIKELIR